MRKTFVIAFRDYLAAVKTKSFLISLALMPLIVAGGSVIGRWSQSVVDTSEKRIAVIDRTAFDQVSTATQPATVPGTPTTPTTPTTEGGGIDLGGLLDSTSGGPDLRPLYQVLTEAAQERDEAIRDEETGKLKQAPYTIEPVTLNDPTAKELAAERLKLSDRVRKGELFAFIEIGPSIISSSPEAYTEYQRKAKAAAESLEAFDDENDDGIPDISDLPQEVLELQDQTAIRYSSKSTTNPEVQGWIKAVLTDVIQRRRLSGLKVPEDKVLSLVRPLEINQRALAIETDDGAIGYEPAPNPVAGLLVPFFQRFPALFPDSDRRLPADDEHHRGKAASHRRSVAWKRSTVRVDARQAARRCGNQLDVGRDLRRGFVPRGLAVQRAGLRGRRHDPLVRSVRFTGHADGRRAQRCRRSCRDEPERSPEYPDTDRAPADGTGNGGVQRRPESAGATRLPVHVVPRHDPDHERDADYDS